MNRRHPNFTHRLFLEDDGKPSFSRVCTAIILAFLLGWDTYAVVLHRSIPDLTTQAIFLGVLYGTNKISTAIQNK